MIRDTSQGKTPAQEAESRFPVAGFDRHDRTEHRDASIRRIRRTRLMSVHALRFFAAVH